MGRITYTEQTQAFGRMEWEDGACSGPLPPDGGEFRAIYDRLVAEGVTPEAYAPPPPMVPDAPTLSDWRVGLALWKRDDGSLRLDEVTKKVADLVAAGHPMGRIARERLEYANNVYRAQLLQLRAALGFSEAELDESLYRAAQVAGGDLSGVWPTKG